MKRIKLSSIFVLFFSLTLIMATTACSSDDDNIEDTEDSEGNDNDEKGCFIHLYDGDNFKDDNLKIEGPAEYTDLDDLPGADGKNWTDEADSFKVGKTATVTVWYETDFEGESKVYEAGAYPSEDEPYSMKITCDSDEE